MRIWLVVTPSAALADEAQKKRHMATRLKA
jgi:hypothetical protein